MTLFRCLDWLTRKPGTVRRRQPLALERLEDRTLPSTVTWTNPSSGNWDVPTNWSTGSVPGSGDDVVINTAAAATITIQNGDNISVHSVTTTVAGNDTLSITGGALTVTAGASTLNGPLSMTGGSLTANGIGVNLTANATTTVSSANLFANGGATLSLPYLTGYANPVGFNDTFFEATGASSTLSLPALASVGVLNSYWHVEVLSGGDVNLSTLGSITATSSIIDFFQFSATGSGSTLNLATLTSLSPTTANNILSATSQGTITAPLLTSLNNVNVTLDGTGSIATSQWTTLTDGSITIQGGSYTLMGLTNITSSNLYVQSGSLSLPGVTSYTGGAGYTNTLEATGAHSTLALANLTGVTVGSSFGSGLQFEALAGGAVTISAIQTITINAGNMLLKSDGAGSLLNVSSLTTLAGAAGGSNLTLQVSNTGTLDDALLASLANVYLIIDPTGALSASQITSLAGTISLVTGSLTLSGLTNVVNAFVAVSGGATLNLPGGISYTGTVNLQASQGSTITLANTSLAEPTSAGSVLLIKAYGGGTVTMSALTSISGGPVVLQSDGANTVINLSALQTFTSSGGATASNGGSIHCGITLPAAPAVWINHGSGFWDDANNWLLSVSPAAGMNVIISTIGAATITFENHTVSIKNLTLASTDTLLISYGTLTSTSNFTNSGTLTLGYGGLFNVNGNEIETAASTINEQMDGPPTSPTDFGQLAVAGTVTLAGAFNVSLFFGFTPTVGQDFPVITFANASGAFSTVTGLAAATLSETLNATSLDLIAQPQPPTFTADSPTTAAVGSAYAYQFHTIGTAPITYSATGLPGWAQIDHSTGILSGTPPAAGTFHFSVTASNGIAPNATVNVSVLAQLEPPVFTADTPPAAIAGSAFSYQFRATGTGVSAITYSATGLPSWAQLNTSTGVFTGTPPTDGTFPFSVTAGNGIAPNTTVSVSLIAGGGTGAIFNVAAGTTFSVPYGIYVGGTTFNVGTGATATIDGGSFTGGVVINVAQGATVNLIGEGTVTYGGTLTGSGNGTVQFSGGNFYPALGGVTLNFPGSMFQWTGGDFFASLGDVTNQGTLNLTGANEMGFFEDGILDNFGTIIQTGAGNLSLHSDNVSPTTLKIEPGASYLLESNSGIDNLDGGATAINNAGTIRKTAGSGTSTLLIAGAITNTGTIEADSGTLYLDANSIAQISGGSLATGTWGAQSGATLRFPTGTSITQNAANLSLGGSGAAITGIAGLSSNSGVFALTGGATFTTSGTFTNSGNLTVGAGSVFSVTGNETETATSTINVQIGGAPSSGQFGLAAVTDTATLAGTFQLTPINGFTGAVGQDFKVMTYANATGLFSKVIGFGSTFSQAINPTSLDLYAFRNPADLQIANVSTQTTATAGQPITVTWQVTNQGPSNATGNWQDSVYLSPTATITASSILLGTAQHSGGLTANGSPYNGMLSATVPALAPGVYYVLVQVDSLYEVSDPNRANNTRAANNQVNVSLPSLVLGTPFNDSFTAADQDHYYQVTVPAGGTLTIALASAASSGATGLYISQGQLPTPFDFQEAATAVHQPNQTATVPQILTMGTYYILAHSVSGNAATASFTLTAAQSGALVVSSIPSAPSGNGGKATVEIDGTNFAPNITVSLTLGSTTLSATSLQYVNASQIFAVFNLAGTAIGNYTLKVQQGAQSATAATVFQVVPATTGNPLQLDLNTPNLVRAGRGGVDYVTVTNISNNDVPAPLLVLSSDGATLNLPSNPAFAPTSLTFLATSPTGQAGTLTAGESVTVPIDFQSTTINPTINFDLSQTDTTQSFDWSQIAAGVAQDSNVSNAAAALTYLENEVGSTWAGYVAMLDRNANLIPPQLGSPNDLKSLFNMEFYKALAAVNTSLSGTLQSSQPGVNLGGLSVYAVNTTSGATFAATTLNDGSFGFSTLPASTYTLSVAGVLLTTNPNVTLNAGQSLTGVILTATQGAQIAGQVLSPAPSIPIAGATIQATNETSGQGFTATADASGNYNLAGLPSGIYDLVATATGYAQEEILGVDVTHSNASETVTLAAPSSISGTIALGSGGAGETTLEVLAGISGSTDANQSFSTSSTSTSFTIAGIPAGTYDMTLSMPGYITHTISSVVVGAGQSLNLGNITLAPASEIDGTIISTDPNNPAGQSLVEALQGSTVVGSTITDSSGNFQITNLPPGTYTLAAPSGVVVTAPAVTLALGQTVTGQSILVQSGGTINGTVTSTTNTPLAGMPVYLTGPGGLAENTTTDSNGSYRFTELNTGIYQIFLLIGGTNTSLTVSVASVGGTSVTANLRFAYAATITGTLTDGSGHPIPDGTMTLYLSGAAIANAQTNKSGVYTFLIIQPGTFDLEAAASEGTFNVVTGLVVNAGSAITQNFQTGSGGLAITANDGPQSVTGNFVTLEAVVDGALTILRQSTIAANGTASFSNLAAGNYTVSVIAGNGDSGQATVSISAGGSANTNVSLAAHANVSGTITDSSANPLSGAIVLVQLSSNLQQVTSATTAADGSYSINGLQNGTYDVTIFANGYLATTQTAIIVSTTATVNAALAMTTTTINGTLVDPSGNPVPSGTVVVSDASGHILEMGNVNPNGSFTVNTAEGNNLVLTVYAQGYSSPSPTSFNAPAGIATQLNPIQLQPVAIDPNPQSPSGNSSQNPLPLDGQTWADTKTQEALQMSAPQINMPPAPQCPNAMVYYNNEVIPIWKSMNIAAKVAMDNQADVLEMASTVTSAAAAEFKAVLAERVAEAAPLYVLSGAAALEQVNGPIQQILAASDQLLRDAYTMLTANDNETIQAIAQDAAAAAQRQQELATYTLAVIGGYLGPKQVAVGYVSITWLTGILNHTILNPFAETAAAAASLENLFDNFSKHYQLWKSRQADFQDAVAHEGQLDTQPCQPNPPTQQPPIKKPTPNDHSVDPNALIGPAGFGTQAFVQATGLFGYTVQFENDGTAAAQDITVTEQLDPNLDWSTFQLSSFGFGSINDTIPSGLKQYQTTVAYQNTDGSSLNVQVSLDFNVQTGLLTVAFTSLDPMTGEAPPGVYDGFLPPNNSSHIGEGYVQYIVQPKTTLTTGTTINQKAAVVFDINAPLPTNTVTNTIDALPPGFVLNGNTLTVTGTGNNDTFQFAAGSTYTVTLNGTTYVADPSVVQKIVFNGAGGTSSAILTDQSSGVTAALKPNTATLSGTNYVVTVTGVNAATIYGGAKGTATFHDSTGSNLFVGTPTYSTLQGATYLNVVVGFGSVTAFASVGTSDTANLAVTTAPDFFISTPTYSQASGAGYANDVVGFAVVHAYAPAHSQAVTYMSTSSGHDTVGGLPAYSFISGATYANYAIGFGVVDIWAGGSQSVAYLATSAGKDTFGGLPTYSFVSGASYGVYVVGFALVQAWTGGFQSVAYMATSAGHDTYVGTPTYSEVKGANYDSYGIGFALVEVWSGGVNSVAYLTTSTGHDFFAGRSAYSVATGNGYTNYAIGFANVSATAGSSNSSADFYAATNNDTFHGSGTTALLSGPLPGSALGYNVEGSDFGTVGIYAATPGTNHKYLAAIDYVLEQYGTWR